MKYLESYNKFKEDFKGEEVNEKWYHNLLTGLMLLVPSMSQAQNLNSLDSEGNKIETVSQEDVLEDIHSIINYVKSNKKEFKNSEKIISQLENLLKKFESGVISQDSMNKIAQEFVKQSKESPDPSINIASIDNSRGEKRFSNDKSIKDNTGFTKIQETTTLDITIESEPTIILVNIFEEGKFESGSYRVDSTLATTVNDTLSFYKSKGYNTKIVGIESSTDGQRLSDNLKKDLIGKGYSGDNEGLSRLRNDALKEYLIKNVDIDSNKIIQDPKFTDNGVIDRSLRYNKIKIEIEKVKSETPKTKESVVCVYYKIYDGDDIRIDIDHKNGYKNHKSEKISGTTDTKGCPTFKVNRR